MIVHNVEQGTQEWFNIRKGKPTASNFKKIITSTGTRSKQLEDYAADLVDEVYGFDSENYSNQFMQRGHEAEETARMDYEFDNGVIIEQVGCIEHGDLPVIYSPDGLVGDSGLWECKSRKYKYRQKHIAYINKNNRVITDDYAQVQGGLWVTGREWIDYSIYHPKGLFTFRQYRDDKFISELEKLVTEVCDYVKAETNNA